jgi:hypothetical protein
MTVEDSLNKRRTWGGELLLSADAGSPREIEVTIPRATAAEQARLDLIEDGTADPTTEEVRVALVRAEAAAERLSKPFLHFNDDVVVNAESFDYVTAWCELARRGFFTPGVEPVEAEVVERSVLNPEGDMRWRVRLAGVPRWAIRALWLGFGWFRRDGNELPDAMSDVIVREPGVVPEAALTPSDIPLPKDDDLEEFLDRKEAALRLQLAHEPDEATLREIYRCLELWLMVVCPGFPRYGDFMGKEEPPVLVAPEEIVVDLPAFTACDPRVVIPVRCWIAREGGRLGIRSCELEEA